MFNHKYPEPFDDSVTEPAEVAEPWRRVRGVKRLKDGFSWCGSSVVRQAHQPHYHTNRNILVFTIWLNMYIIA